VTGAPNPEAADRPSVDELFEQLLSAEAGPTPQRLEELCAAHPHAAVELRDLVLRWGGLAGALHTSFVGAAQAEELLSIPLDPDSQRYELLAELGRGGMGVVHRARDRRLLRDVALKVLRVEDGAAGGTLPARRLARFLEEARVASRLGHPGIAPVHELGRDESGRVYFTMPLVEGEDFEHVLEHVRAARNGWSTTRALGVLLRVAEAVAFAHSRGVLHRDLKPANVMVGRFGEAYVMDWGLARVREASGVAQNLDLAANLTLEGDVMGTPAYMPPEQAAGRLSELDARADIYALGAILYHVLALRMPYARIGERPSARVVLERVRVGPPQPLSELQPAPPAELVAICERAMQREPARRYATMEALAEDLRAFLEGRVVSAYESGGFAELRKWVLRNKRVAALALLALGTAIVGLVAVLIVQTLARAKVESLSDHQLLTEIEGEARELWPALPERLPALDDWLRRANELAARLPAHEARLAELDASAAALRERAREAPGSFTDQHAWTFEDATARWQHDKLVELVHGLRAFGAADGGANRLRELEARRASAATIEERSLHGPVARVAWERARSEIAADPRYRGLVLAPQAALLPLGRDPQSGLQEFAHMLTGAAPTRDADGRLELVEASALVLVLVPGGSFLMGARAPTHDDPPGAPNVDPDYDGTESPVNEVRLEPFFLSKYEVTNAQWRRWICGDPRYPSPRDPKPERFPEQEFAEILAQNWRRPVMQVSWNDATDVLAHLGLILPAEAQWECAARAGTSTPWYGGSDIAELVQAEFVPGIGATLAPVGTHRANPFGLHDALGNVSEWCYDKILDGDYRNAVDPVTGRRQGVEAGGTYVYRGGNYLLAPKYARCAQRYYALPDQRVDWVGIRPARLIQR
jgi:formylglycine-generating enzyme required for sulfatase activity